MLSAAVHELRGPLGVARGYLRLLTKLGADDPRARKAIGDAGHAADRIAALLDELSHYGRLACGEAHLHIDDASLRAILEEAARRTTSPAGTEVGMTVRVSPDVSVRADRARLVEACTALTTALAHAQVASAATIVSTVAPERAGAGSVLRVVLDPHLGSTSGRRPPRLDRSGAGLSLAIADLVIRLHGGALFESWVEDVWIGYEVPLNRRFSVDTSSAAGYPP